MALPSWNVTTLPGDSWTTVHAQDNSTSMQPSASSWHKQGTSVTSQELHALDDASWMHVTHGPVNLGLSPVLSQESQSSRTLNSFSEPDVPFLPPGLDLSFIGETSWQTPGHVVYPVSQCVPQDYSSSTGASPQHMPYGMVTGQPDYSSQSTVACGPQQQAVYYHDAQVSHPRTSGCDQSMIQGRPLLPRTDGHSFHGVQPTTGYVALQPRIPGLGNAEPQGSVSNVPGMPREAMSSRSASVQSARYMEPAHTALISPMGRMPTPCSDGVPVGMPPSLAETANEDFNSFIRYDQEDKVPATVMRLDCNAKHSREVVTNELSSYSHGYGPADSRPALAIPEQDVISRTLATPAGPSIISETDEGRYRNHPLYSEGPHADGLYHCPFKSDPSCQHKATKLKCNYEYDLRR